MLCYNIFFLRFRMSVFSFFVRCEWEKSARILSKCTFISLHDLGIGFCKMLKGWNVRGKRVGCSFIHLFWVFTHRRCVYYEVHFCRTLYNYTGYRWNVTRYLILNITNTSSKCISTDNTIITRYSRKRTYRQDSIDKNKIRRNCIY